MMTAKKRFGQHFLKDPAVLQKIVDTIDPMMQDTIIEIGPGRGVLTQQVVSKCQKLIAVEIDNDLIPILINQFRAYQSFQLVHQDILNYTPSFSSYKLVGNIPYNLTTKLFEHIMLWEHKPSTITFLIQKEEHSTGFDRKCCKSFSSIY